MARPSTQLIDALRQTAARLQTGTTYQWTHSGHCNCGHLAQTITTQSPAQLHQWALQKHGDWADKAEQFAAEYLSDDALPTACPASRYPIDHVLYRMLDLGLYMEDVVALERLSDRAVLQRLPAAHRDLDYKRRSDVVVYLNTWADLLEDQLAERAVQRLLQTPVAIV